MGQEWSWPCSDREERKFEVKTGRAPIKRKVAQKPDLSFLQTDNTVKLALVPIFNLDVFFQEVCTSANLQDLYPKFIFQSPLDTSQSVVLFYPKALVQHTAPRTMKFKVHPYTLKNSEEKIGSGHLSFAVNMYDDMGNLEVLGGVASFPGITVVYGQRTNAKPTNRFEAEEMMVPFSPQSIGDYLSTRKREGKEFKAAVGYQGHIFILFEKTKDDQKPYFTAMYDTEGRREDVLGLPAVLESQVRDYSFEGVIVQPMTGELILIFKDF
jgi:hypothetical protein